MTSKKTIEKEYSGKTYVFIFLGRGYMVYPRGFAIHWYQPTASVRLAKKIFYNNYFK